MPEDAKLSSAEQKRRCTIKNGFELLRALLPALAQTPSVKISKAALLAKGAEHVLQLSREGESSSSWCRTSLLLVILSYTLHTLLSPAQPGAGSTSQLICLCLHLNIGSVHSRR